MKKTLHFALFFLALAALTFPLISQAQILPPCTATGNCGICDFLQTFVNIIRWVLGIIGGSALFFLIYFGFVWILSGGSAEKVEAGRKGMINTVIGIFIVLFSWMMVNVVLSVLLTSTDKPTLSVKNLFNAGGTGSAWFNFCNGGFGGQAFCEQGWGEGVPCDTLGNFCLKRPKGGSFTCKKTDEKGVEKYNACEYWATHNSRKEYEKYQCVKNQNNCKPGKNLGHDYCINITGENNATCCEPIEDAPTDAILPNFGKP